MKLKPLARLLLAALLLLPTCVRAAGDAAGVLPARLADWERAGWKQVGARDLESLVGPQAGLLREYGSLSAESAEYSRGDARWQVTLHRMQDRSGAYGAFTLLRADGAPVALGEAGARTGSVFVFYQGNYFVTASKEAGEAELGALARLLAAQPEPAASLPLLPSFLPQQGLLRGSERYLLGPLGLGSVLPLAPGDWTGFAYGAEVVLARYRVGGVEAALLLISYPTPQIARERLADFERLFNLNGTGDPLRPLVYAKRSGTLVSFVSGLESGQAAASVLEQVPYEMKVSWSDPSNPRPEPEWAKMLVNIFIGTGVVLLFTFLSAVAYGLLRLLIKRLFPGVLFDRPSENDLIILKLEGPSRK